MSLESAKKLNPQNWIVKQKLNKYPTLGSEYYFLFHQNWANSGHELLKHKKSKTTVRKSSGWQEYTGTTTHTPKLKSVHKEKNKIPKKWGEFIFVWTRRQSTHREEKRIEGEDNEMLRESTPGPPFPLHAAPRLAVEWCCWRVGWISSLTITRGCNSPQPIPNLSLKVLTDTAL
jgi:hypothetical protein